MVTVKGSVPLHHIYGLPLPPLQTADVPGSCEKTLLQTSDFSQASKNFLLTQEKQN